MFLSLTLREDFRWGVFFLTFFECENINKYKLENPKTSILIITHYPRILEYIKPDYVHMMVGGKIVKTGNYDFAFEIEKNGYNELVSEDLQLIIKIF